MSRHLIQIPIYALTPGGDPAQDGAVPQCASAADGHQRRPRHRAERGRNHLKTRGIVQSGDIYAITCGEPMGAPGGTNMLKICRVTGALNALVASDTYQGEQGVAYGPDPRQKLDVYKPLGNVAGAPVVVFFYGGNWSAGDRADYRFVGEALAASGAIAIVADYRLSPQVRWQQILQDCALATRWAFDRAPALGGDPRRIYLMGHSAGGYNAAMLALDSRWLRAQGLSPERLAGWIGLAGAYDFLPIVDPRVPWHSFRCASCWTMRPPTATAFRLSTSTTWSRCRPSWRPPRSRRAGHPAGQRRRPQVRR
jgi:pimeloyl-ACP methyl ester carboxylesterase